MEKRKNIAGITLIALIITIIVMLILASISITVLTGNNGIFGKATKVKEESTMRKAEEEIKLILNEWKIEQSVGMKSFEPFLTSKVENNKIDFYEKVSEIEAIKIYRNGYYLLVDYEGNILEEIQKGKYKTEATYELISNDGINCTIKIEIKNQSKIQRIIEPNGNIINGKEQTNVIIDNYVVENNKEYQFKIQVQEEEEIFILKIDPSAMIQIIETSTEAYPIITKDGINEIGKIVEIENSENKNYYYSLDDGNSWLDYKESIKFTKEGTIKVKEMITGNKIAQIASKKIILDLASDSIDENAYDRNYATYMSVPYYGDTNGDLYYYALIDSSAIGKTIELFYIMRVYSYNELFFLDKDNNIIECNVETLQDTEKSLPYLKTVIPEGAKKFKYKFHSGWNAGNAGIAEIEVRNERIAFLPIISEVTQSSFTITANIENKNDEIEKYEYYIKASEDSDYKKYESTKEYYTIDTLKEDTLFNIYVKAYNKVGYYDKSEEIDQITLEDPQNKIYLYNRGNENEAFTGGWIFSGGYDASSTHWTKYDDYMQISCPPYTRSYIRPNNLIDLTEYSSLKIIGEGVGWYYIGEASTIGGDPVTGQIDAGENRINIKNFTGKQYINLNTAWNTFKIYEVYLKK